MPAVKGLDGGRGFHGHGFHGSDADAPRKLSPPPSAARGVCGRRENSMRKIIFRASVVGREEAPCPSKADLGAQDDAENGNGRCFTRECDAGSAAKPLWAFVGRKG